MPHLRVVRQAVALGQGRAGAPQKSKDPDERALYNETLYYVSKLFLNSLYGRCLMKIVDTDTKLVHRDQLDEYAGKEDVLELMLSGRGLTRALDFRLLHRMPMLRSLNLGLNMLEGAVLGDVFASPVLEQVRLGGRTSNRRNMPPGTARLIRASHMHVLIHGADATRVTHTHTPAA